MQSNDPTLAESIDETLLRAGFARSEDYVELLRTSLRSDVARHRVLALRGAVRQSLVTADDWLAALGDFDVTVRREALAQVAYVAIEDDRILEVAVSLLDDRDPLVVDAAIFAIGEHFYAGAIEELCEIATNHDDARCRESAVAALGAVGDDRGRGAIIAALEDKAPVRRRAIVALANFEGPDIEAALERARTDRDWQVRAAVDQLSADED